MLPEINPENEPVPKDGTVQPSEARRRLLRGGLAAAPVIMTVASRPVLASTCTTASAWMSVNASRPNKLATCSGNNPSYWAKPSCYASWPSNTFAVDAAPNAATKFQSVFGSPLYPSKTLLQVLQLSATTGSDGLARYVVAALLNARAKLTTDTPLTEAKLKLIWTSFAATGTYSPTAGIIWGADASSTPSGRPGSGIIGWIQTTMN